MNQTQPSVSVSDSSPSPVPSPASLARPWQDLAADPEMIECARRIAKWWQRKEARTGTILIGDEFESEAYLALCKVAQDYCPDNPNASSFRDYFHGRIGQMMIDLCRSFYGRHGIKSHKVRTAIRVFHFNLVKSKIDSNWIYFIDNYDFEQRLRWLPKRSRQIVRYVIVDGLTQKEIAKILELSENYVSILYRESLEIIRFKLNLKDPRTDG